MKKLFLSIVLIFVSCFSCVKAEDVVVMPSQLGVVTDVKYVDLKNDVAAQTKQTVQIKLLNGNAKGGVVVTDNLLTGNPYYDINLKKGMKVLLHVEDAGDGAVYSVEDIYRSDTLFLLMLVFCGLLVYVGKRKGLYSLVSIVITCTMIFGLLSPMILAGINPVLSTILICLLSTAATMYLVGGINRKSTSATIGCTLSLIFAGILSFVAVKCAHLTGFSGENSMYLYSAHPELNLVSILISSMMLATLGAVMDVGMSIASTINEIYSLDNTKTVKELFVSGMNVGRDIIGTMANTLILVYMGASLPLLLLSASIDMQKFFNLNQVVTEIASALIGSSAIVICVPVTAIVASELVRKIKNSEDFLGLEN